jgi:hypothetical protein
LDQVKAELFDLVNENYDRFLSISEAMTGLEERVKSIENQFTSEAVGEEHQSLVDLSAEVVSSLRSTFDEVRRLLEERSHVLKEKLLLSKYRRYAESLGELDRVEGLEETLLALNTLDLMICDLKL